MGFFVLKIFLVFLDLIMCFKEFFLFNFYYVKYKEIKELF